MIEHFVNNNGVRIHAIELNSGALGTPIIMVPGMINSAEAIIGAVGNRLTRRTIILSIRGRGKSDSPEHGWRLEDQASDVAAVVNHFEFPKIVLFGHSTGGTFAARSIPMIRSEIAAILLGDFPPLYPSYSEGWRKNIKNLTEISITALALEGIVRDAQFTDVSEHLKSNGKKLYVIVADEDKSYFKPKELNNFQSIFPHAIIERLNGCGHEFLSDCPSRSASTIERIATLFD